MIKKSQLAILALLVMVIMVCGCTDNKNNTTNNNSTITNNTHNNTNTNNTANNTTNSNIKSPKEAKAIAQQYINEPGVTAGTPVLNTVNGRQVYIVPLYKNGQAVGEIELDAKTGENLGGAGGAP